MPATETTLRLEFSVPQTGFTVNALLERAKVLPAAACAVALEEYQEQVLVAVLGLPWMPQQTAVAPWSCPKCGSRYAFSRRGARERKFRSSLGRVIFGLRQITCLACKARGCCTTFSPFPELLGLPARVRVSAELLQKGVDAATRLSYQQSSELTEVMTGQRLSPMTIHKRVQEQAQAVHFEAPTEAPIVLLDSTKVKAGPKRNGIDLNLALAVSAVQQDGKRSVLEKSVIAMGVGNWTSLKEALQRVKPRLVLVDGDDELERLADEIYPGVPRQRCLWHLPRTLGFTLWKDGVSKRDRDRLSKQLQQLLHQPQPLEAAQNALRAFADTLGSEGHTGAHKLLHKAAGTAFTHRALPKPFPGGRHGRNAPIATSYIERQMREIDRRVDNGARWTPEGALNLLRLRTVRRLTPGQWKLIWNQSTGN